MDATHLYPHAEVHGHALPEAPDWACWQLRPLQEFQLCAAMVSLGIPTYLPKIINREKLYDEVYRKRDRALFPGYLFSEVIPPEKLTALFRLRGIRFAFRKVGMIPVEVIADLRSRENEQGYFVVGSSTDIDNLTPGQRVAITKPGIWFGQTGLFSRKSSDRVAVLMAIFGRECLVEFSRDDVVIA